MRTPVSEMVRPEYCEAGSEGQDDYRNPCPACGATASGDDPVKGVCQARRNGPPPRRFLGLVLQDKDTGEIVARVSAYH